MRLDHALKLWRHGAAPLLIVTGGQVGDIDEVSAMAAYLAAQGAPPEAIIEARPGDNTRQSLQTLGPLPHHRYIAVSTPSHSYRITAEAKRQGLSVTVNCPATTPEMTDPLMHAARLRSEVLAVMLYAMPDPVAVGVLAALGRWRHSLPHVAAGRLRLRDASRPRAEVNYRALTSAQ
ncbi:MAG: YdcF family protein [Actinomycetes bacterium]